VLVVLSVDVSFACGMQWCSRGMVCMWSDMGVEGLRV
jgi:hypothetical protein